LYKKYVLNILYLNKKIKIKLNKFLKLHPFTATSTELSQKKPRDVSKVKATPNNVIPPPPPLSAASIPGTRPQQ